MIKTYWLWLISFCKLINESSAFISRQISVPIHIILVEELGEFLVLYLGQTLLFIEMVEHLEGFSLFERPTIVSVKFIKKLV